MLTVRRATLEDIPNIMDFFEEHWLHGYVLAHDRAFFDWQFVHDDIVNLWIGIDEETKKIYSSIGVIFYSYVEHPDIAGTIWLAIKSENPLLSADVQEAMWTQLAPRESFSPGLRKDAIRYFKLVGMPLDKMDHYYRLSDREEYYIAVVKEKVIPKVPNSLYQLHPISSVEEMQKIIPESVLFSGAPRKDYAYIRHRYFEHPIFHYEVYKITDCNKNDCGILIMRKEEANGQKSCKIVDFYGENALLGKITAALDELLKEKGYEFIDIYSYGVPKYIYENAGFVRCEEDSENIIPNYFQPYIPENSDIWLTVPNIPNSRLFRGDGDQDKPRLLNYK